MRCTLMLALVAAAAACSREQAAPAASAGSGFASIPARHNGLGRAATPAEVAARNIDVGPDGEGLPTGSGTAALGADLFQKKCAMCHGPKGQGMPPAFPLLISRDPKAEGFRFASDFKLPHSIGNYWPDATTVFDYVRRAMPLLQPGSLTNDEVYSLTAFLLAANDVIPMSATLDSASLMKVKMPYHDKFVSDNRKGGSDVK
ncbi:MAG: c-type cytochrome [Gemmatimonadaceae bacterium]